MPGTYSVTDVTIHGARTSQGLTERNARHIFEGCKKDPTVFYCQMSESGTLLEQSIRQGVGDKWMWIA